MATHTLKLTPTQEGVLGKATKNYNKENNEDFTKDEYIAKVMSHAIESWKRRFSDQELEDVKEVWAKASKAKRDAALEALE
jgi:hypothetical protein